MGGFGKGRAPCRREGWRRSFRWMPHLAQQVHFFPAPVLSFHGTPAFRVSVSPGSSSVLPTIEVTFTLLRPAVESTGYADVDHAAFGSGGITLEKPSRVAVSRRN